MLPDWWIEWQRIALLVDDGALKKRGSYDKKSNPKGPKHENSDNEDRKFPNSHYLGGVGFRSRTGSHVFRFRGYGIGLLGSHPGFRA